MLDGIIENMDECMEQFFLNLDNAEALYVEAEKSSQFYLVEWLRKFCRRGGEIPPFIMP